MNTLYKKGWLLIVKKHTHVKFCNYLYRHKISNMNSNHIINHFFAVVKYIHSLCSHINIISICVQRSSFQISCFSSYLWFTSTTILIIMPCSQFNVELLVTYKISNFRSHLIVQNKDLNNFIKYLNVANVYQFICQGLFVFNKMTQDMIPNILNLQK